MSSEIQYLTEVAFLLGTCFGLILGLMIVLLVTNCIFHKKP